MSLYDLGAVECSYMTGTVYNEETKEASFKGTEYSSTP